MPVSAPISTSGGWRVRGESEHVALGSPRGSFLYLELCFPPGPASCAGGFGWERVIFELPLVPSWEPAALPFLFSLTLFYFFCFLVESQGKLRLGIQNSSVSLDLKKKQTLDMVRGSISKVFIFSFVLEHS